jgi:hypothetical protein
MDNKIKLSIICRYLQSKGWFNERELDFLIGCRERIVFRRTHYSDPISIMEILISLIFIDGLHLYENVREDFLHFEKTSYVIIDKGSTLIIIKKVS